MIDNESTDEGDNETGGTLKPSSVDGGKRDKAKQGGGKRKAKQTALDGMRSDADEAAEVYVEIYDELKELADKLEAQRDVVRTAMLKEKRDTLKAAAGIFKIDAGPRIAFRRHPATDSEE